MYEFLCLFFSICWNISISIEQKKNCLKIHTNLISLQYAYAGFFYTKLLLKLLSIDFSFFLTIISYFVYEVHNKRK